MSISRIQIDLSTVYRRLFESAAEALLVAGEDGRIVLSNPKALEMFGYSQSEFQELKVEDLIPVSNRRTHKAHRDGYHQNPEPRSMGEGLTLKAMKKGGEIFPVEISLNHMEVEGTKFAMALITDITKRTAAEEKVHNLNAELEARVEERTAQLEESQTLYSAIARNFPNGTINVFDKSFNYIFTEGKELFKLGITSEHLIGTNYLSRLSEDVKGEVEKYLYQALKGENNEVEIIQNQNNYLVSFVGLKNKTGKYDKILVVEQNISRQKQAEREIIQALEHEKDLNELKTRFVSTASHEFRTPLSTILSSASILERYLRGEEKIDDLESRQERHLKKIQTSVSNLTGILNDFLSIDKLESGMQVNRTVFSIKELMDEIVEEIKEVLKPGQVIEVTDECDEELFQDRSILKNITINLLSNASKYSEPGDTILLHTSCERHHLKISVKDQGIGIPKADQRHLFTRFFRASNATNHGGTGLGLHIVKKYSEMLNGSIAFNSESGSGSHFIVTIPNAEKQ